MARMISNLLHLLPKEADVIIGYSGGVDSHVLLHALSFYRHQFRLRAVHIHHGLMPNADEWSLHCLAVCQSLKIPCEVLRVEVTPESGESLEECARKARYAALSEVMQKIEGTPFLLTAHHMDDQAETCLLQFLRGSGPRGLAAMPLKIEFANGFLVRPLLKVSRQAVISYAKQNELRWIEDESNHDTRFARNFVRYRLMPLLQERYPGVTRSMMRVADHAAESEELLQALAQIDYPDSNKPYLEVSRLKELPVARQKNIIRLWLKNNAFKMPSQVKLSHILSDVLNASVDANPLVAWDDCEIRRYRDRIYAMAPLPWHDAGTCYAWDGKSDITIPNIGVISAEVLQKFLVKSTPLVIKFRRGGEKLTVRGMTKPLKKYFQEKSIPPWRRDRIPLVYCDEKLIAILDPAVKPENDVKEKLS